MTRSLLFFSALIFAGYQVTPVRATPETDYQRIMQSVNTTTSQAFAPPQADVGAVDATGATAAPAQAQATQDAATAPQPVLPATNQQASGTASTEQANGYSPKNISIYGQPQFHQNPGIAALEPPLNQSFPGRSYNVYATNGTPPYSTSALTANSTYPGQ